MEPGFFARLWLAFVVFFRVIFNPPFAAKVLAAKEGAPVVPVLPPPTAGELKGTTVPPPGRPRGAETTPATPDHSSALQILAILQREGRFVDFLQEDIGSFGDDEVGAAARIVHDGCRKAIAEHFVLEPLRADGEGATITLEPGFDPAAVRLTGNVAGNPPFTGALRHHGWRAAEVKLPKAPSGQEARIIAPAEVEL